MQRPGSVTMMINVPESGTKKGASPMALFKRRSNQPADIVVASVTDLLDHPEEVKTIRENFRPAIIG